ncbi:hypothetical protein Lfu02_47420 [Longispora fulva]|uniref:DUF4097 and DUF4098 domain-containing protein YvlB n=1 Tax=Longispora fulva TaxID=619741 RepID=A0A8J7KR28_9ACTN|nr:DUF4097 family beta strand repeat-containing protein [Longispora fulva]MBG6138117.1 DUF4097 and DUF4098 domain-containing protein YvlB [Longispora fulva]GIG60370.1 hypothetical protein Lfu02_47420 [Longispora fulva]
MYDFAAPGPINGTFRVPAGSLEVTAEPRDTVVVTVEPGDSSEASRDAAANTRVELVGDELLVEAPESKGLRIIWKSAKLRVTARIPEHSTVTVKVASADARLKGRYSEVRLNSASGEVHLDEAARDAVVSTASGVLRVGQVGGSLKANTASGDLYIGDVGGSVDAHSASGDITIGGVQGEASTRSASGDIRVGPVGGSVKANTASGDVEIASTRSGMVKVNTASGDVKVGVLAGTAVWLDLSTASGRTTSDLNVGGSATPPTGSQLTLQIRTASGDIEVHRVHNAA